LICTSISHFWDRPVPIFSDVRFSYLALVQDKKNHVRFTGKCMLYNLCWRFFFMKHSWTNSLNLSFSLVRNSCVEGREVKCFNAIVGGEGPRLYVQIFRVLQNPHLFCLIPAYYVLVTSYALDFQRHMLWSSMIWFEVRGCCFICWYLWLICLKSEKFLSTLAILFYETQLDQFP
jgi:hypothetical protein